MTSPHVLLCVVHSSVVRVGFVASVVGFATLIVQSLFVYQVTKGLLQPSHLNPFVGAAISAATLVFGLALTTIAARNSIRAYQQTIRHLGYRDPVYFESRIVNSDSHCQSVGMRVALDEYRYRITEGV